MIKVRGTSGFVDDLEAEDLPLNAITEGNNFTLSEGSPAAANGYTAIYGAPPIAPYWCIQHVISGTVYWIYTSLTKAYRVPSSGIDENVTRRIATAITAASVANPTTITAAAHGLATGDPGVITGDTTATPTINGTHTVTVTGANTFTIPVNVTIAGTNGTVTGDSNYTGTVNNIWNGTVLGTIPIINNGADPPQMWDSATSKFKNLTAWTAGNLCKTMRSFKNYLVALNVTKSGANYPQKIKWSHGADPLAVPVTWDETDPTKDAGEKDFLDSTGYVIDGGQLRDSFIIYKEDSTHLMRHIGGQFVFSFQELSKTSGILAVNCWQEYKGLHYVLTQGDMIAHDGNAIIPLSTRRMRNYLFNQIDPTNYYKSYVTLNPRKEEVWFCFPTLGSTHVNKAVVYHVVDEKWSVRDLPNCGYIGYGIVALAEGGEWSTTALTWDVAYRIWDYTEYNPSTISLLYCGTANTLLYKGDTGYTANGANYLVTFEKTGNAHFMQDAADESIYKYVASVWPRFNAPIGTVITVSVGVQDRPEGSVMWSSQLFTVGTSDKVDFDVSGRFWGVKFETTANVQWSLSGYDVDVKPQGGY